MGARGRGTGSGRPADSTLLPESFLHSPQRCCVPCSVQTKGDKFGLPSRSWLILLSWHTDPRAQSPVDGADYCAKFLSFHHFLRASRCGWGELFCSIVKLFVPNNPGWKWKSEDLFFFEVPGCRLRVPHHPTGFYKADVWVFIADVTRRSQVFGMSCTRG